MFRSYLSRCLSPAVIAGTASVSTSAVEDGTALSSSPPTSHSSSVRDGDDTQDGGGGRRPQPSTKEPWENLQGLLVSAKYTYPQDVFTDKPLAMGRLTEKISHTTYRVKLFPPSKTANAGPLVVEYPDGTTSEAAPPLTLDIGTRVKIFFGERTGTPDADMLMGGTIVKVNGNGTYTLLMTNDEIELSVSPERIAEMEEQTKALHNAKFIDLVEWLRSSVHDPRDCEAIAYILYHRGWRVERMYLLEKSDLAAFVFVSKLQREGIMEKAQWERDHHNVIRLLHRERVKDRDLRYALSKYKGTISCIAGIMVVSYVFSSNLRAYLKQQRSYQLKLAARTIAHGGTGSGVEATAEHQFRVDRSSEEEHVRDVLRRLDTAHPRIVVFTGFAGSGKSAITRDALEKENMPAVYVDIRGSEDTLRSVVKAIGVQNIDVCGDLLDFVAEALQLATLNDKQHRVPVLSIKLREGSSLEKVYREAVGLVSDRQVCHILLEVPLESLTPQNVALPRLDFYIVPEFTRPQAYQYTQYNMDPLDVLYFIEVVGTNSNDLDELYAAVRQRGVSAVAYTSLKLMKAMRRVQAAADAHPDMYDALAELAAPSFEEGLNDEKVEAALVPVLHFLAEKDIVLYDPVQDRWLFTQKVLHTAARCIW